MNNRGFLISILLLISFGLSFAQQSDSCKVLLPEISGNYVGNCKDGLADGKGIANGIDNYSGKFKMGLPDGKGKYTYNNGNEFTGNFTKGFKNGKGKFTFSIDGNTLIQKGYWLDGEYTGTTDQKIIYRVTNRIGLNDVTIKTGKGVENEIRISIVGCLIKYIPSDLMISFSSGDLTFEGRDLLICHYRLPVTCSISFSIKGSLGMVIRVCKLDFDILEPGSYNVIISV